MAAWVQINFLFLIPQKKFATESNLREFNEKLQAAFFFSSKGLNSLVLGNENQSDLVSSTSPDACRRENLVSELQKVLNCYLISCCFSLKTRHGKHEKQRGGGEGAKSWKNFPKYMPEAEKRKQWVKRVMMGNRSEIKLKTKHHGELFSFPSSLRRFFSSLSHFYEISFRAITKIFAFFVSFANMEQTRHWMRTCGEPNAMILSIEEMKKVI